MEQIAWRLSPDGRELAIIKVDPVTRRVKEVMRLPRKTPMTPAEAQRYVDDNYPKGGSAVRVAAETLGSKR
jgi:hypothetical protein